MSTTDTDFLSLARPERIEAFKNMLVTAATSSAAAVDERLYRHVRSELLADKTLEPLTPRFVRTCRNGEEFWQYIKQKYGTYAERRAYMRDEFDSLLSHLEKAHPTPVVSVTDLAIKTFDETGVHDVWTQMLNRRTSDPEGAITAARTLVETVCKHILDGLGETYSEGIELPALYNAVASKFNLAPSQHTEQIFKQILGGCATVVNGLAGIRNRLSDAHGKGKSFARPAARHAELAVNLAGALTAFLIATWRDRTQG
jgi:hypothetical protein